MLFRSEEMSREASDLIHALLNPDPAQRLGSRAVEGTVKGDAIKFSMKGADGMPDFEFNGVLVDKDNMKGTLEMGGMGSASFTGKRAP